ncbi:dnaJ homolog subfamily C member 9-like [Hylaeus volcanicus]|uniref:dnaJ homolog subfamily C member 9-like n=1 Tax=Hylaeus volcanicus TaxID=313075 RepID=UPI0023B86BC6|nr:dnaJ homolog subfamily C member 9-like [Hylaeus volcanicus]
MSSKISLYSILGVDKDAPQKQIIKAFRLLAIQLHPDKRLSDKKVATEEFQALQTAYEVLGDPRKREIYDSTGEISDDLEIKVSKWRGNRAPITLEEIVEYEKLYKGSTEEKQDLAQMFLRFNGDVKNILEYIPFSKPCDVDRYIKVLQDMIAEKVLTVTEESLRQFRRSQKILLKHCAKYIIRSKKEKKKCRKEAEPSSLDALVQAIQEKKQQRKESSFFDALEAKYCKTKKPKTFSLF